MSFGLMAVYFLSRPPIPTFSTSYLPLPSYPFVWRLPFGAWRKKKLVSLTLVTKVVYWCWHFDLCIFFFLNELRWICVVSQVWFLGNELYGLYGLWVLKYLFDLVFISKVWPFLSKEKTWKLKKLFFFIL